METVLTNKTGTDARLELLRRVQALLPEQVAALVWNMLCREVELSHQVEELKRQLDKVA